MTTVVPQLIVARALLCSSLPHVAASRIGRRGGLPSRVTALATRLDGVGSVCATGRHQPHRFLWGFGLSCKQTLLPFLSLCPPPLLPPPPSQLPQLESSARVYFHGWGVKTALSLFWLPCLFPVEEVECPGDWGGPRDATWRGRRRGGGRGGRVSQDRSRSNRVRGQLQQFGCQSRGQVFKSNVCTFCFGDVHIFPLPLLAMDGTEVGVHQLHDLSQLGESERERKVRLLALRISLARVQEGGAA